MRDARSECSSTVPYLTDKLGRHLQNRNKLVLFQKLLQTVSTLSKPDIFRKYLHLFLDCNIIV